MLEDVFRLIVALGGVALFCRLFVVQDWGLWVAGTALLALAGLALVLSGDLNGLGTLGDRRGALRRL
jgi:hypothetical protein